MFGGSMFPDMENDPFFNMHRAHMQQMNSMMQDPFAMHRSMMSPFMAVSDGREQQRDIQRRGQRHQERSVARQDQFVDPFQSMFGNMNSMMSNMRSMMNSPMVQVPNSDNSNFYSSSTVMSYSSDGQSQPKIYQASTSTKQSGGVKETRKTVRDSHKGIEKMAIGRHIGDKAHLISKERDRRTGDITENQEMVNLDEDDLGHFEEEWRNKAPRRGHSDRTAHRSVGPHHRPRHHTPAIEHRPSHLSKH